MKKYREFFRIGWSAGAWSTFPCLLVLGCMALASGPALGAEMDAEALFEEGRDLLQRGLEDLAVEKLEEADRAANGTSAKVLRLLLAAQKRREDHEAASESSLRLFRMQPAQEFLSLRYLVRAYETSDRSREILPLLREFLDSDLKDQDAVWAWNELGCWIVMQDEDLGETISAAANEAFFWALELNDGFEEMLALNLAETFWRQGHEAEAREIVEQTQAPSQLRRRALRVLPLAPELEEIWKRRLSQARRQQITPSPQARTPKFGVPAPQYKPRATKVSAPMPQYPEEARKARIQGTVVLNIAIDTQGYVEILGVVEELPMGLTEASIEAVKTWRFEPPKDDAAQPMATEMEISVNFSLQ